MYEVTHRENYKLLLKYLKASGKRDAAVDFFQKTSKYAGGWYLREKKMMMTIIIWVCGYFVYKVWMYSYYIHTQNNHEGNNNPPIFNEN